MNINNLNKVNSLSNMRREATNKLHNLENHPHLLSVRFMGKDASIEERRKCKDVLITHYQNWLTEIDKKLIELGVDLSDLPPEPVEEEEEEEEE